MHITRVLLWLLCLSAGVQLAWAEGSSAHQTQAQFQVVITGAPVSSVCATQPVGKRGVVVRVFCHSNSVPSFSAPGRADVFTRSSNALVQPASLEPLPDEISRSEPGPSYADANRAGYESSSYESFIRLSPDGLPSPQEIEVSF